MYKISDLWNFLIARIYLIVVMVICKNQQTSVGTRIHLIVVTVICKNQQTSVGTVAILIFYLNNLNN